MCLEKLEAAAGEGQPPEECPRSEAPAGGERVMDWGSGRDGENLLLPLRGSQRSASSHPHLGKRDRMREREFGYNPEVLF